MGNTVSAGLEVITGNYIAFRLQLCFSVCLFLLSAQTVEVLIKSSEYMSQLLEQAALHFFVTARVNETGRILAKQKAAALKIPQLNIKVSVRDITSKDSSLTTTDLHRICFSIIRLQVWSYTQE